MKEGQTQVVGVGTLIGAALGFVGADVLFVGSAMSLLPWSLAGLALGVAYSGDRWRTAIAGASYGFALAYVFMLASYDGTASVATRLLPFVAFGAFGAVCGVVLALTGGAIRSRAGH